MADKFLTTADISFVLSVPTLAIVATNISGFAVENIFDNAEQEVAINVIGADAKKSSAWKPHLFEQTVHLQADSDSRDLFDLIAQSQDINRRLYRIDGVVTYPSLLRSYILTNGTLTTYKPVPDAKGMSEPTPYKIVWESVRPSVI